MKKKQLLGLYCSLLMALGLWGYAVAAPSGTLKVIKATPVTNTQITVETILNAKSKGTCTTREWTELCPGSETKYRSCEITTKCEIKCRGVCPDAQTESAR